MTRLLVLLLTLLFSLSGPAMGGYSDLERSSFAVRAEAEALKVGRFRTTETVAKHATDVVERGPFKGDLARPFLKLPHSIEQIIKRRGKAFLILAVLLEHFDTTFQGHFAVLKEHGNWW